MKIRFKLFKTQKLLFLSLFSIFLFIATFAAIMIWNIFQINNSPYYKTTAAQGFTFTTVTQKQQFRETIYKKKPLLAKKKIVENFTAQQNYLGTIAVPFNTYNKSVSDTIIFRIKQTGSKSWYAQNTYAANQLQTDVPFPFGFPVITNSKNKSYTFEIESLNGKSGNVIALSSDSFFITKYAFSKAILLKDHSELLQFVFAKGGEGMSQFTLIQFVLLLISLFVPFTLSFGAKKQARILLSVLLTIIILNILSIALAEVIYPYPREYRDPALTDIAHQFVIGVNPYTINTALPHTYSYGFISSFLNAILTKITNLDLVITQHIITFLCMIILCFIVGKEIFRTTRNIPLVLVSLIVVLLFNSVSLRPEPLAVLLTTLTLYFVHHTKVVSFKKIILLSLSVITLYYIKQYFILLLPVLVVYFIFNQSKKNLGLLLLTTFVVGIASVAIISQIFPLYFPETFISYINYSGGPSIWTNHKMDWIIKQSIDFIQLNWLLVPLFIVVTLIGFVKDMVINFNVTDSHKPLFIFPVSPLNNIYFVYGSVAIFFLTFLLGYNGGAYLSYYFQMLPIPLCVFTIPYFYKILQKYKWRETAITIFLILFICEYSHYIAFPLIRQTEKRQAWNQASTYINKFKHKDIYLSPIFVTEAIKNGWPIYDNGQTDFYSVIALTPDTQKLSFLSPQNKQIVLGSAQWQKGLDQKIIHKKFALIVRPEGYSGMINDKYLFKYYVVKQKMSVPLNFGDLGGPLSPLRWQPMEFWEPK